MKKVALVDADYDGKIEGIIKILKSDETFKDYNYQGSAIRSIIRVLALVSSDASLQANLLFNERFAHTAEIRKNVVAASQNMGYRPRSRTAAKLKGDVRANLETEVTQPILRKTTVFVGIKDGQTVNFSPKQDYIGSYVGGTATFSDVELLQGAWKSFSYELGEFTNVFSVTLADSELIDSNTLKVFVEENGELTEYEIFRNVLQLGKESKLFYLDYNSEGQLVVELGDGNFSYKPSGGTVYIQFMHTLGSEGNGIQKVTPIGVIENSADITFEPVGYSLGGASEESVESIRKSSRGAFGSGGLAVVANQYVPICKNVFPSYEFSVWGGEKNNPPKNGYVMVCGVNTLGRDLTENEIEVLFEHLKTVNVGSITPRHVPVTSTSIKMNVVVYWVPSVTSLDSSGVSTKIASDLTNYFYENLIGFNKLLDPFDFLEAAKLNTFFSSGYITLDITKNIKLTIGDNTIFTKKPIKPKTVNIKGVSLGVQPVEITDDGQGNILINSEVSGSVDYEKGVVILGLGESFKIGATSVSFSIDGVEQSYTTEGNETLILEGVYVTPMRR